MDLFEAIEEGSTDALDNTDLLETDIPLEVPLPETPHLPRESHEAVKEWVLAVSMDQKVEQRLPVDERMTYEASLITANTGTTYQPCIITGKDTYVYLERYGAIHKPRSHFFRILTPSLLT